MRIRAASVLRKSGVVLAYFTLFSLALVIGFALHLDLPPARRALLTLVNTSLRDVFLGSLTLESVDHVGLDGVRGVRVSASAPTGQVVLRAEDVDAELSLSAILKSALFEDGPLRIVLPSARTRYVDVSLDRAGTGELLLAQAFTPVPSSQPSEPGRGVDLRILDIQLDRVDAHSADQLGLDASVLALRGALRSHPDETVVDVGAAWFTLNANPIPTDVSGSMLGQLSLPSRGPLHAHANLDVHAADVPIRVVAQLDGDHLRGGVIMPDTPPEHLQQLIPGMPVTVPASVEVQVDGTLPKLEATGLATLADGRVAFLVQTDLSSTLSAKLNATVAGIAPKSFDPGAPDATVNADVRASVENLTGDPPLGNFDVAVIDSQVEGNPVPSSRIWGTFRGPRVEGQLTARAQDATAAGSFTVAPMKKGKGVVVVSALNAQLPSLRALRVYAVEAEGAGHLHADATLRLTDTPEVTGSVRAQVEQLRAGPIDVSSVSLLASVQGPLESPRLDVSLKGNGLRFPYVGVSRFAIDADGPVRATKVRLRAAVQGVGDVNANTTLQLGKKSVVALDTSLGVRGKHPLDAHVRRIAFGESAVDVDALRVDGLGGALAADLNIRGDTAHVRARGDALQVERILSFLPSGTPRVDGLVSLNVDLAASRRHLDGYANVTLRNGRVAGFVDDARADIDLRFRNERLTLSAKVEVDDGSRLTVEASGSKLRGSPWSPEVWTGAVGGATLDATLDLQRLGRMIPDGLLPLHDLAGTANVLAVAHRNGTEATGSIEVTASTTDLRMVVDGDPKSPMAVHGVDAGLHVLADARSGQVELRGALRQQDRNLVTAGFETRLPIEDLVAHPGGVNDLLTRASWQGGVVIPRQSFHALPEFIRPSGILGELEARIAVEGNITEPSVSIESKVSGFQFRGDSTLQSIPLNLELTGQFHHGRGRATADISGSSGTVASVASDVELLPSQLISAGASEPRWALSTEVDLHQFPIQALAPLIGEPLEGLMDGRIQLTDLHQDAKLSAEISSDALRVGRAVASRTNLQLSILDGELTAKAKLEQKGGGLDLEVKTGAPWGAALTPTFDPKAALAARLRATTFDLSTLGSMPGISELAGILDANVSVEAPVGDLGSGKLQGRVELKNGVLKAESIGQRLHDINALLTVDPSGLARLERLEVRGPSGKLLAAATSRLRGLLPVSTRAVVRIPAHDPFPIVFDGVDYGTVVGNVAIAATWKDRLEVDASVSKLHFELPPTPTPNLQDLGLDDTIEVGAVRRDGSFVRRKPRDKTTSSESPPTEASSSFKMRLSVLLGDKVTVARGGNLQASVRGKTTLEVGDGPLRIGGSFEIPRGTVDLRGRRFKIVEATLSVNEDDPTNPVVSATAEYNAPGDYVITAQFTGTVQSGSLTLSSQPALTQPQILNLIAFGSPEGPAAARSGESSAAAGLVGDEVSQGVNALIGDVTSYEVSTRLDTSHEDVRPEVALQVTPEVTVQLTFVPTHPTPGQNPDRTILTLEYRFRPRWALEASVGDEGTSVLDLLWRYRY